MTNKKEVFNKKELIGEKVHCAVFGNGVIHSFLSGIVEDLVLVRFFNNGNEVTYYYDGTRNKGENPTLSFGHKEDVEFDYGMPSVKQKPLIFKDWLEEKGIDTNIFWKNCKRKYNGFGSKRKSLINSNVDGWIDEAFFWEQTLLDLSDFDLRSLSCKWVSEAKLAEKSSIKIELGF